jgi:hypothetical protein
MAYFPPDLHRNGPVGMCILHRAWLSANAEEKPTGRPRARADHAYVLPASSAARSPLQSIWD